MSTSGLAGGGRLWYPSGPKLGKINRNPTSSKYGKLVDNNGELAEHGFERNTNPTSSKYGQYVARSGPPNWGSSSSSYTPQAAKSPPAPFQEPAPDNWEFVRERRYPNASVLEIRYPNCTNYEGRKILVFKIAGGLAFIMKKNKGLLDPHFLNDPKYACPFARFEPTEAGWEAACKLGAVL